MTEVGDSPREVQVSPAKEALAKSPEEYLNGDFEWTLAGLYKGAVYNARGQMRLQGLETLRDVLVLGSQRIERIPYVGPKTTESIRASLNAERLPFSLDENPGMETIASLCEGPGQVLVQVLGYSGVLAVSNPVQRQVQRITIADAVAQTPDFLTLPKAKELHTRALEFQEEFWHTKGLPE